MKGGVKRIGKEVCQERRWHHQRPWQPGGQALFFHFRHLACLGSIGNLVWAHLWMGYPRLKWNYPRKANHSTTKEKAGKQKNFGPWLEFEGCGNQGPNYYYSRYEYTTHAHKRLYIYIHTICTQYTHIIFNTRAHTHIYIYRFNCSLNKFQTLPK